MSCCNDFRDSVEKQFSANRAKEDLRRYRRLGPDKTTRRLADGLTQEGLVEGTLLDVGSGVGALSFELMDRGVRTATLIEASSAYESAASDEASRRGRSADVAVMQGDFVELADRAPRATLVTMDRVVCCYPRYEPLLAAALDHAERAFAFSYPRDRWYVRAAVGLENALRRRRTAFRMFVHPETRMRMLIEHAGFALVRRRRSPMWSADVFVRRDGPETSVVPVATASP